MWLKQYEEAFEKANGYPCEVVNVGDDSYRVDIRQEDFLKWIKEDLLKWTKEELILATRTLNDRIYEE